MRRTRLADQMPRDTRQPALVDALAGLSRVCPRTRRAYVLIPCQQRLRPRHAKCERCRLWTQSVGAEAPPTGHPVSLPKCRVVAATAATSEAGALSDGAICWNRSPSYSAPSALAASFPYASDLSRDERNGRPDAIGANSVGTEVPPTVHPASKPQAPWGATPGWPQAIGRDEGSGNRDGVRQCWAENTSTTHPEQPGPSPAGAVSTAMSANAGLRTSKTVGTEAPPAVCNRHDGRRAAKEPRGWGETIDHRSRRAPQRGGRSTQGPSQRPIDAWMRASTSSSEPTPSTRARVPRLS